MVGNELEATHQLVSPAKYLACGVRKLESDAGLALCGRLRIC
jgi:hypothetical protein